MVHFRQMSDHHILIVWHRMQICIQIMLELPKSGAFHRKTIICFNFYSCHMDSLQVGHGSIADPGHVLHRVVWGVFGICLPFKLSACLMSQDLFSFYYIALQD